MIIMITFSSGGISILSLEAETFEHIFSYTSYKTNIIWIEWDFKTNIKEGSDTFLGHFTSL